METLQEHGWYLTEQGYDSVTDFGSVSDLQKITKRAIDMDLREIGNGQGKVSKGNVVLQIQKVRNIAAPKYNEESRSAPRMLKLSLTDGKNNYQAVEIDHISGLGLNTPPGTKILLKAGDVTMSHGILLLGPNNLGRVLGGKVTNLVEKWELNRKLATHSRLRSVEEGGPPPWIPFGKKIMRGGHEADKNFKALGIGKEMSDKETTEFEAQRQDAIAEAARLGGKKIFGGGNKQLLDHNVQLIADQEFAVKQIEYLLGMSQNHVHRGSKGLPPPRQNRPGGSGREPRETRESRPKRFEKKTDEATKPSSGKVSLFDFLEDKLPAQSDAPETQVNSQQQQQQQQQQQHHQRSSDNSGNYRGQRGGRGYQAPPRHASEVSKYSKRPGNENYNSFTAGNTYGNSHRAPRFQRNQETHGNHQESINKSNYPKSSQNNDRRSNNNGASTFPQSRVELGIFNSNDPSTCTNKNPRHHDDIVKNHHATDKFQQQVQQTENGPKNQRISGHESSRGKQNRNSENESAGGSWVWKLGDDCMAKYWEDNRYYNAQVTAISARTCVVRFKDFDNYEEVLQADCIPITDKSQELQTPEAEGRRNDQRGQGNRHARYDQSENHISGMEFRRGGGGGGGGGGSGGNISAKGYNRKRGQQRSAQAIYQPPAQRGHSSVATWTLRDNPPL